ncbi:hypothetical protein [Streptomyces sp. NPDC057429]|uniref:hypothetical protein n=1 Tax=Streptomyces sp. NPDC057429 TaxID=3346130 RepID=UPI00369EE72A
MSLDRSPSARSKVLRRTIESGSLPAFQILPRASDLLAGVLAGALVLSLAGPLSALGAAGATVLALHKLMA